MPFLFAIMIFISLWLVQAIVLSPINLLASLHLPFWLSVTLGGIVFSWLLGE